MTHVSEDWHTPPKAPGLPPQRPVQAPDKVGERVRCFVMRIEAEKPTVSRFCATVHYAADHAYEGAPQGSFYTVDGRKYELGQVLWVTIEVDR
jgi:hypothetical protein